MAEHNWMPARRRPEMIEYRQTEPGEVIEVRGGTVTAQEGDYLVRSARGGELYLAAGQDFERANPYVRRGAMRANATRHPQADG